MNVNENIWKQKKNEYRNFRTNAYAAHKRTHTHPYDIILIRLWIYWIYTKPVNWSLIILLYFNNVPIIFIHITHTRKPTLGAGDCERDTQRKKTQKLFDACVRVCVWIQTDQKIHVSNLDWICWNSFCCVHFYGILFFCVCCCSQLLFQREEILLIDW